MNIYLLLRFNRYINCSTAKNLGADLDVMSTNYKSYFPHPSKKGERVYIISDPSHMIKNIRNAMADTPLTENENKESGNKTRSWPQYKIK